MIAKFREVAMGVRRAASRSGAPLLLLSLAAACGGRYDGPGGQKPDVGDPAPSTGSSAGTSSGSHSGSSGSLPTHPLGACTPGFDHNGNPARPCEWVTEMGECFDSFDAACACLCPTSGNSVCSGSLSRSANGATTVYCDKV